MTILLTSLGTGNYHPSSYQIEDSISDQQAFFSVALAKHLSPDRVISLQTSQAADLHGTALANDLKRLNIDHEVVSIPEGKSENELWQIFSVLTSHIPQACTLHLDITHGFRSLPLLGFIALNYLRVTRNITIGSLRYGAWEAKNNNDIAPSFDLSPFLTLLDWSAAADQFKATGAADRIARLLKETQISLWKNRGNEGPKALPKLLSTLAQPSITPLIISPCSGPDISRNPPNQSTNSWNEFKRPPSLKITLDRSSNFSNQFARILPALLAMTYRTFGI